MLRRIKSKNRGVSDYFTFSCDQDILLVLILVSKHLTYCDWHRIDVCASSMDLTQYM